MTTSDFELLYGNDTKMDVSSLAAAILFTAGPSQKVISIEGLYDVVTLAQLNLDFVDNTADIDKPISTATQEAIDALANNDNVLTLDNETPFTPTGDYNPATLKIVEDLIAAIDHDSLNGFVSNEHIDWTSPNVGTIDSTNYEAYTHPSTYVPNSAGADTGPLTGAYVVSDIDMNISNNAEGHVTSANMYVNTRQLTLGDLGFTGSVTADDFGSFGFQIDSGTVEDVLSGESINLISGTNVNITSTGKDITIDLESHIATDTVLGGVKSSSEILVDAGGVMTIAGLGGTGLTGVATLENGLVPISQLPGAFGDFVEYADYATMIANGDGQGEDTTKTYITLDDDNTYKWTGTEYINISGTGVDSIAGQSGVVTLTDIGLDQVSNTSDANKPISTAQQTALDLKVDENADIVAGTGTKVTYDAKGLVTGSTDATTADIAASTDKNYVTDDELIGIGNISGFDPSEYTKTGIDPNYEQVVIGDVVIRESDVLDTNPITVTNKIVTEADVADLGGGDMLSTNYDTGVWDGTNSVDNARTVGDNGSGVGFTVSKSVPVDAIFGYNPTDPGTDGTDGSDGLLEDSDKFKLDNIEPGAQVNTVEVDSVNIFTAAQRGNIQSVAMNSGFPDIDFNLSNRFELIMTQDVTGFTPTNATAGQGGIIYVVQDATGSRNINAWNPNMIFIDSDAPVGGSPNAIQIYTYEVYSPTKIIMAYAGTI